MVIVIDEVGMIAEEEEVVVVDMVMIETIAAVDEEAAEETTATSMAEVDVEVDEAVIACLANDAAETTKKNPTLFLLVVEVDEDAVAVEAEEETLMEATNDRDTTITTTKKAMMNSTMMDMEADTAVTTLDMVDIMEDEDIEVVAAEEVVGEAGVVVEATQQQKVAMELLQPRKEEIPT